MSALLYGSCAVSAHIVSIQGRIAQMFDISKKQKALMTKDAQTRYENIIRGAKGDFDCSGEINQVLQFFGSILRNHFDEMNLVLNHHKIEPKILIYGNLSGTDWINLMKLCLTVSTAVNTKQKSFVR